MLVAVVMAGLFAILALLTWRQFIQLRYVTEKYIQCDNASHDMQEASDYLTDRARMFVETGNVSYMEDYFTEANVTKRREQAIVKLESYIGDSESYYKLIRHEADNDALTDTLNRGSFDRLLKIYNGSDSKIALIICDIDSFKTVNDTYGHAVGDEAIKKVARLLKKTFRSMDYVCRLGGDEFAVIMLEVSGKYSGLVSEKINYINSCLKNTEDGLPAISISAGAAFADRKNPTDSIFNDADTALYYSKEHGKCGCSFYPAGEDSAETGSNTND